MATQHEDNVTDPSTSTSTNEQMGDVGRHCTQIPGEHRTGVHSPGADTTSLENPMKNTSTASAVPAVVAAPAAASVEQEVHAAQLVPAQTEQAGPAVDPTAEPTVKERRGLGLWLEVLKASVAETTRLVLREYLPTIVTWMLDLFS